MEEQEAEIRTGSEVATIRGDVKRICHEVEHTTDINLLLEQATQLSEYLFYIQEQEQKLHGLVVDAKQMINQAKESVKTFEFKTALRLNSTEGGGYAMNRAEKMAYLKSENLRQSVTEVTEALGEVDKDYRDIKGFKTAVQEYLMTIRQKVKNLQIEAGVYPIRPDEQTN